MDYWSSHEVPMNLDNYFEHQCLLKDLYYRREHRRPAFKALDAC